MVGALLPMGSGRQVHEAAKAGHTERLSMFLAYWRGNRDSPEVLNWLPPPHEDGDSPLAIAVRFDQLGCVDLLLRCVPAVDVNKGNLTALHRACQTGRVAVVRALLAVPSIATNKKTSEGRTPLHEAAQRGHAEVVRLLVAKKGIQLDAEDKDEVTPYEEAVIWQHSDVVAILREAVAKKRQVDEAGRQVSAASMDPQSTTLLPPLLARWSGNADVLNWADESRRGAPAIVNACTWGRLDVVRLLLDTPGVDVNESVDSVGRTPLACAAMMGHTDIVRALLAVPGIDLNKRATGGDSAGKTALGHALARYIGKAQLVWHRNQEIAALLRAVGAEE